MVHYFSCMHPANLQRYLFQLAGYYHFKCTRCGATWKRKAENV